MTQFGYKSLGFGSGGGKPPYDAEWLVVAKGGTGWHGGHGLISGGGGAGGFRSSYTGGSGGGASPETDITISPGTVYTCTVGGGDSSIAGADITTITSVAGGKGGGYYGDNYGFPGGSGGGPSTRGSTAGTGTANQGFDGETPNPGSGGGAAEAGGTDGAGNGGDGVATAITGASVTLAGGGGNSGAGDGGGGNNNNAGTANTGGGGGTSTDTDNNSGGSGVVILRVPTANYSGTTTGSPTVTTDGDYTVVKFTGTGTYTA